MIRIYVLRYCKHQIMIWEDGCTRPGRHAVNLVSMYIKSRKKWM
jgi:hypothetical protein